VSKQFLPLPTATINWIDGQPFSVQHDDVYYSKDGGIGQSEHVFINGNDLIQRFGALKVNDVFTIGETGFGTGLNFLTTLCAFEQYAPKGAHLHYISCEKHPLTPLDLQQALERWDTLAPYTKQLIRQYPILTPGHHHLDFKDLNVKLTLMLGDAFACYEQLLLSGDSSIESHFKLGAVDAWYLDGFAPKKNESMWSEPLIACIAMLSSQGSTLSSYTAARVVKDLLSDYGFDVLKKPGFGPKRHMICAVFSESKPHRLKKRETPWHVSKPTKPQQKSAIILGAGLAGVTIANTLAQRGWQVTIIDENNEAAFRASAVPQAVLFPKLSAFRSPLTQVMLQSFIYAHNYYQALIGQEPSLGVLNGSILLAMNDKELKAQESLTEWLSVYPLLGRLLTAKELSSLAGIELHHSGLYIPLSGWMNTPKLCAHLLNDKAITLKNNVCIKALTQVGNHWQLGDDLAEVVVLANSHHAKQFAQTSHLPLKCIRGQLTKIKENAMSKHLVIPVCGEGHVLPSFNGAHLTGASYDLGVSLPAIKPLDDLANLKKLGHIAGEGVFGEDILDNWSDVRASTPDYLPLVGPAPMEQAFLSKYMTLSTNANRWIPSIGEYYPNLYVFAGFGSRGLTTIPYCAEWLSASINGEISGIPRSILHALSPARFLRRKIVRTG
jgi:tRNA 5-methylaminomethyl-2-thiouridine biosynthesis bifunctional protein